jgi:hypothetical protein
VSKHPRTAGNTIAVVLCCLLLWVCPVRAQLSDFGAGTRSGLSSVQQIAAEFTTVPCSNDDRLAAAVALFERLGAKRHEISVEDLGVAKNVVVTVPGTSAHASSERIVIGAHFDKVAAGCGAFDNWTGMVAIAHMYGTVKNLKPS